MSKKNVRRNVIACISTVSVACSALSIPAANANFLSHYSGEAFVDIVGKNIDPNSGQVGWDAFAQIPQMVEPTDKGVKKSIENQLSFVLPAQCVDKPELVNATQSNADALYSHTDIEPNNQESFTLTKEQATTIINGLKADPQLTVELVDLHPKMAVSLIKANEQYKIDPNFSIIDNGNLGINRRGFPGDGTHTLTLNDVDPQSLAKVREFFKTNDDRVKNLTDKEIDDALARFLQYNSSTLVVDDSHNPLWDDSYTKILYGMNLGGVSYTNASGQKESKIFFRHLPGSLFAKTLQSILDYQAYQLSKHGLFRSLAGTDIFETTVGKSGKFDLTPLGDGSNDDNNPKMRNNMLIDTGDIGAAIKVPEGATKVSRSVNDLNSELESLLTRAVGNQAGVVSKLDPKQHMYSVSAINKDFKPGALKEDTDIADTPTGPRDPQEFVKITDSTGKQWWQRSIFTQARQVKFSVTAHVDQNCLIDNKLISPGKDFYVPAQVFWKRMFRRDPSGEMMQDPWFDLVEYPYGQGLNTKNNPNATLQDADINSGDFYPNIEAKPKDQWKIPNAVSDKGELITRGVLKADTSNTYDQRQGIYGNPSCIVSRNTNHPDELNTAISDFNDGVATDFDDHFPGAIANGISEENPMRAGFFTDEVDVGGNDNGNFDAFSIEDMCDQAAAKISMPEKPKEPETPVVTTVTVTTTPPPVTQVVTTTPEPVTKTVVSTTTKIPTPVTVTQVSTPNPVTETVRITQPPTTVVKTTTVSQTPKTFTETVTPEPKIVYKTTTPAPVTKVVTITPQQPTPVTVTNTVTSTPKPVVVTHVVTQPPTTVVKTTTMEPTPVTVTNVETTTATATVTTEPTPSDDSSSDMIQSKILSSTGDVSDNGSNSGSGIFGIIAGLATVMGIIGLIANVALKLNPAPNPTHEPIPAPPAPKPQPEPTVVHNDPEIVVKDGLACPAYALVKGVCKPMN